MPCCSPLGREALTPEHAVQLARMFKALGDPVRLRILALVARHEGGESCVCDISPAFDLSQPTMSHHLKVLREAGILESERRGTWVYYRANPAALEHLSSILTLENGAFTGPACDDAASVEPDRIAEAAG